MMTLAEPLEQSTLARSSAAINSQQQRRRRRPANMPTTWKCINTLDGPDKRPATTGCDARKHQPANCKLLLWSTLVDGDRGRDASDDDDDDDDRDPCDTPTRVGLTPSSNVSSWPSGAAEASKRGASGRSRANYMTLTQSGSSIWAPMVVWLLLLLCMASALPSSHWAHQSQQKNLEAPRNQSLLGGGGLLNARTTSRSHLQDNLKTTTTTSGDEERAAHWSLPNRPSLFSIIRFPNEECFDSSNQSGTCYTAFECKLLGGQPSSPCAAGFGSCCIVSRTCHVTTREKVVYFKNPSYPSADSDEKFCDLTVEMGDINVCQLRLDFLDFQLDPPTNGACKDDYMEISASGMPPQTVPRLCGLNRNQHLYINVPQDLSERSASIVFYTDPVGDHRWQVKVTQIDCNHYKPIDWKRQYAKFASSPLWNGHPNGAGAGLRLPGHLASGAAKYSTTFASGFQTMSQTASALAYEFLKPQFTPRAPMGCLQYFTQPSGIIESFNFGHYLNNMDYSICVQRQPDTCRVVFTSSDYDWSLNGVGVSGSSSGVGDQDCARDYLLIPGGSRTGDGFTYDRYCGGRLHYYRGQALSAPIVIKTSGPIVLRFHSDAHFEGLNNGGFRLQYDQSAQDCIYHTPEEAGSLASQQIVASTLADSRPLSPLLNEGSPAMYAAQQVSATPVLQQLSHIELDHPNALATDYTQLRPPPPPPLDVGLDPNRRQPTSRLNDTTGNNLGLFHISQSDRPDQIKRNDYLDGAYEHHPTTWSHPAAGLANSNHKQRHSNHSTASGHLLLPLDLTKAFQLITARSARWLGSSSSSSSSFSSSSSSSSPTAASADQ